MADETDRKPEEKTAGAQGLTRREALLQLLRVVRRLARLERRSGSANTASARVRCRPSRRGAIIALRPILKTRNGRR